MLIWFVDPDRAQFCRTFHEIHIGLWAHIALIDCVWRTLPPLTSNALTSVSSDFSSSHQAAARIPCDSFTNLPRMPCPSVQSHRTPRQRRRGDHGPEMSSSE